MRWSWLIVLVLSAPVCAKDHHLDGWRYDVTLDFPYPSTTTTLIFANGEMDSTEHRKVGYVPSEYHSNKPHWKAVLYNGFHDHMKWRGRIRGKTIYGYVCVRQDHNGPEIHYPFQGILTTPAATGPEPAPGPTTPLTLPPLPSPPPGKILLPTTPAPVLPP
jgi:hypothetical protein